MFLEERIDANVSWAVIDDTSHLCSEFSSNLSLSILTSDIVRASEMHITGARTYAVFDESCFGTGWSMRPKRGKAPGTPWLSYGHAPVTRTCADGFLSCPHVECHDLFGDWHPFYHEDFDVNSRGTSGFGPLTHWLGWGKNPMCQWDQVVAISIIPSPLETMV